MHRLTPWRRALPLIGFGIQVTFLLLVIAITPHVGSSGCPQPVTAQAQADRFAQFVALIDLGLLMAVALSLVYWSSGRRHRYVWIGITLIPAILLAALSLGVAALGTISLCNMIQT
jgi:hypothetical protein